MKVRKVFTDGFRGLHDRELSLVDPRTDSAYGLVVVTGKRGSGKTSFLEAIIAAKEQIGPYGAASPASAFVRQDASAAKVRIEWELSSTERDRYGAGRRPLAGEAIFGDAVVTPPDPDPALAALLGEYVTEPEYGKIEYFHASRRLPLGSAVDLSKAPGADLDRMTRLLRDDMKYSGLVRFMVEAGLGLDVDATGKPRPQGRVSKAFEALCPTKKIAGLYRSGEQMLPAFMDDARKTYSLAQLSDSELDALIFAVTFVRQAISGSVVLIDTPEKHLGDVDARELVKALAQLGADNQLIVATQAPSILASVQSDQILRLG
jgi:predicted ATPase